MFSVLAELRVRRHVLCRSVLGVMRCPAIGRQLTGCKGVFDPAKPLLVHLDEETRKPPFADHYRAEKTLHFLRSQSAEPIYVRLT